MANSQSPFLMQKICNTDEHTGHTLDKQQKKGEEGMGTGVNNKVRKPVSFNKLKPADIQMLKFLGRRNFSGYIKKLIKADMELQAQNKKGEPNPEEVGVVPVNVLNEDVTVVDTENPVNQTEREPQEEQRVDTPAERLARVKKQLTADTKRKESKVFVANHLQR